MNRNEFLCTALYFVLGAASPKVREIYDRELDVEKLFESDHERRLSGLFTDKEMARFYGALKRAHFAVEQADKSGQRIISYLSEEYPERLKNIYAPPCALYVRGVFPEFDNEVAIAMVGTRNATDYGRTVATDLAMILSKAGALVVSGAAKGVDSYSHTGALQVFGRTAAVLGCGIDYPYLMENKPMRDMIEKRGVLISEYPPGTAATRWSFPERNRIISGLSLGTVIIEAGIKSGSLITANYTLEQGRELFAVPGSVMSPSFAGTNKLLREGAKPVFSALDILEEFAGEYPHKIDMSGVKSLMIDVDVISNDTGRADRSQKTRFSASIKSDGNGIDGNSNAEKHLKTPESKRKIVNISDKDLSDDEKMVYNNFIAKNSALTVDELIPLCGIAPDKLMRVLTSLELEGLIEPEAGNKYRIL